MPHAPASPRFVHTPFFTVKAAARFHHPWPAHQVAQCFSLSCLKKKISCKGANVLRVPLWPLTCMAHFWWQPRSVRTVMCFCHSRKHLPLLLSCKTQRAFCLPPVPPPSLFLSCPAFSPSTFVSHNSSQRNLMSHIPQVPGLPSEVSCRKPSLLSNPPKLPNVGID